MRLPAEALLGEVNKGFYYLMNELPQVSLYSLDTSSVSNSALIQFFFWGAGASDDR